MRCDLRDKIVLVTGASRGLGRAIALASAQAGARVWLGYHQRSDAAEAAAAEITEQGGQARCIAVDVSDPERAEASVAELLQQEGQLDVLVNAAGMVRDEWFALAEASAWREILSVNLDGSANMCRAVARPMIARKQGAIVNVASVAGLRASPGQASYAAAKAGIIALTRTLGSELAGRGIRVNCLVPGFLATGSAQRMNSQIAEQKRKAIPLGRFGRAEEAAQVAVFLASDVASYIVGQAIVVDGGLSL